MIYVSWQLTVFTIVVSFDGVVTERIGRKLKHKSLDAQTKWSSTMSQLEETLGGMRIIKAFTAKHKMTDRFDRATDEYRSASTVWPPARLLPTP